jgi:hypothetical protein
MANSSLLRSAHEGRRPVKLPNADHEEVRREKLVKYLLSRAHPDGAGKAAFYERFGFSADALEVLRDALLEHARQHEVVDTGTSDFGARFTVEGPLRSPDGRNPLERSVWFIDAGAVTPRLVTAYPQRKENT